jgi:hypothetical protein
MNWMYYHTVWSVMMFAWIRPAHSEADKGTTSRPAASQFTASSVQGFLRHTRYARFSCRLLLVGAVGAALLVSFRDRTACKPWYCLRSQLHDQLHRRAALSLAHRRHQGSHRLIFCRLSSRVRASGSSGYARRSHQAIFPLQKAVGGTVNPKNGTWTLRRRGSSHL